MSDIGKKKRVSAIALMRHLRLNFTIEESAWPADDLKSRSFQETGAVPANCGSHEYLPPVAAERLRVSRRLYVVFGLTSSIASRIRSADAVHPHTIVLSLRAIQ